MITIRDTIPIRWSMTILKWFWLWWDARPDWPVVQKTIPNSSLRFCYTRKPTRCPQSPISNSRRGCADADRIGWFCWSVWILYQIKIDSFCRTSAETRSNYASIVARSKYKYIFTSRLNTSGQFPRAQRCCYWWILYCFSWQSKVVCYWPATDSPSLYSCIP